MGVFLRIITGTVAALLFCASPADANPVVDKIVNGDVHFDTPDSKTFEVHQHSQKAIVDYKSFNIQKDETTRFIQPNSSATILNRITGSASPSQILGSLEANGNVFLLNPNGIVFGENAIVDVHGLLATTHSISDQDFWNENYTFNSSGINTDAAIENLGLIQASSVGLIARSVKNEGVIRANLGTVTLAATAHYSLDFFGDGFFKVILDNEEVEALTDADGNAITASVTNDGSVIADGGTVTIAAQSLPDIGDSIVNLDGVVQADGFYNQDGNIVIGSANTDEVIISGTVQARGIDSDNTGGNIEILGENILLNETATADVSGQAGGGEILIGGEYLGQGDTPTANITILQDGSTIAADATGDGDGGKIIVWSDRYTITNANIFARGGALGGDGGFIETSSKGYLEVGQAVNASAENGVGGTWLLDPWDVEIRNQSTSSDILLPSQQSDGSTFSQMLGSTAQTSIINTADIETTLNSGTSVNILTYYVEDGAEPGDLGSISVFDSITKTSGGDASLTLSAREDILLYDTISSTSGALDVTLDLNTTYGNGDINNFSSSNYINTNGGTLSINANGNINLDLSSATRTGDLDLTYRDNNINSVVGIRWGSDIIQLSQADGLATIASGGIQLNTSNTATTTNFYGLNLGFENNAVTFSDFLSDASWDFNNTNSTDGSRMAFGSLDGQDGIAEMVNFGAFDIGSLYSADSFPAGLTPVLEVDLNDQLTEFSTFNQIIPISSLIDIEVSDEVSSLISQLTEQVSYVEAVTTEGTVATPSIFVIDEPNRSFANPEELAANLYLFGDNGRNLENDPEWARYPREFQLEALSIAYGATALLTDFLPVIGMQNSLFRAFFGRDPYTQAELTNFDRGLELVSLIPFGGAPAKAMLRFSFNGSIRTIDESGQLIAQDSNGIQLFASNDSVSRQTPANTNIGNQAPSPQSLGARPTKEVEAAYANESSQYSANTPFTSQKIMDEFGLEKIRFGGEELPKLIDIYNDLPGNGPTASKEIIYVQKADGELVFSIRPRTEDYLPHPVLSNGEAVLNAGKVTPTQQADGSYSLTVDNQSGHFRTDGSNLDAAVDALNQLGFTAKSNNAF